MKALKGTRMRMRLACERAGQLELYGDEFKPKPLDTQWGLEYLYVIVLVSTISQATGS